jgi:hypothetical protein
MARTEFYKDGKMIAGFQGDMEDINLTITGDTVRWSASKVDHSTATKTQADGMKGRIEAAIGAASLIPILK